MYKPGREYYPPALRTLPRVGSGAEHRFPILALSKSSFYFFLNLAELLVRAVPAAVPPAFRSSTTAEGAAT